MNKSIKAPPEVLEFTGKIVDALIEKDYDELTKLGKMLDEGHLSEYIADHKFEEKIDSKLIPRKFQTWETISDWQRLIRGHQQGYAMDPSEGYFEIDIPEHIEKRKYVYIGIVFKPEKMAFDVHKKVVRPHGNLNDKFSKEEMEASRSGAPIIYQRTVYRKAHGLPKVSKPKTHRFKIRNPNAVDSDPSTWYTFEEIETGGTQEVTRQGFEVTYFERDVSDRIVQISGDESVQRYLNSSSEGDDISSDKTPEDEGGLSEVMERFMQRTLIKEAKYNKIDQDESEEGLSRGALLKKRYYKRY